MNYHSDDRIMNGVLDHLFDPGISYKPEKIVGIFYQGSGNYGMDYEGSDIDTKLVLAPSLKEICMNTKPVSTTYIRENEEHTDLKDVRLMIQLFKKQNLNFVEILFTKYKVVNHDYKDWDQLVSAREAIAHYDQIATVKTMKGIAMEKYYALQHEYPSKVEIIKKYGYDPKQLHHLLRVDQFLTSYTRGRPYEECLCPSNSDYLVAVKRGYYNLDDARSLADKTIASLIERADKFREQDIPIDVKMGALLDEVQYKIICKTLKREIVQ